MTTHSPQAAAETARAAYRDMTGQLGKLGLDTAIPEGVRALADRTVRQNRGVYDYSLNAFDASVSTFERSFDAVGQGAAAFSRKFIDMARRDVDASFNLANSLTGAKTLTDMVELQAIFLRKQFGILAVQAEEVRQLSTNVIADTVDQLNSQMARGASETVQTH